MDTTDEKSEFPSAEELAVLIARFAREHPEADGKILAKQSFGFDIQNLVYVRSEQSGGYGYCRCSSVVVPRLQFDVFEAFFKGFNQPFITMGQCSDQADETYFDIIEEVIKGDEKPLEFLFAVSRHEYCTTRGIILDTWSGEDDLGDWREGREITTKEKDPQTGERYTFYVSVLLGSPDREKREADRHLLDSKDRLVSFLALCPRRNYHEIRKLLRIPWTAVEVEYDGEDDTLLRFFVYFDKDAPVTAAPADRKRKTTC